MANRLTRIYTRTGDAGTTGLADGSRVSKDAPRVEAIGAVDELNSALGVLLAEELPGDVRACLDNIQHDLFDLGGELSVPGHAIMSEAHSKRLEKELDAFNAGLPALKEFILPGGSRAASLAHLARTVCRRAERTVGRALEFGATGAAAAAIPEPAVGSAVRARPFSQPRRRPR